MAMYLFLLMCKQSEDVWCGGQSLRCVRLVSDHSITMIISTLYKSHTSNCTTWELNFANILISFFPQICFFFTSLELNFY